ncbi:MAG: LmeA family phospholipid-binding protein [Armatimonadota bacterium]|nr:LmeA family phospholipid-binding protein [Armatimonadota bacterium]
MTRCVRRTWGSPEIHPKPILLLLLAFAVYLLASESHRLLEGAIQLFLRKTFPGCHAAVSLSVKPLWFLSGDFERIAIELSNFDGSHFPHPAANQQSPEGDIPPNALSASVGSPTSRPARIGLLDIHFTDFQFGARHITSLHAQIPGIRYDYGRLLKERAPHLRGSGAGSLDVALSGDDLNEAAAMDRQDIRALRVQPGEGHLLVTMDYHTLLGWVPVSVTGRLSIVDGHAIEFVDAAISAGTVSFPQAVTDYVLTRVKTLNPIFDVWTLHLPVDIHLHSVEMVEQGVNMKATLQVPGDQS